MLGEVRLMSALPKPILTGNDQTASKASSPIQAYGIILNVPKPNRPCASRWTLENQTVLHPIALSVVLSMFGLGIATSEGEPS